MCPTLISHQSKVRRMTHTRMHFPPEALPVPILCTTFFRHLLIWIWKQYVKKCSEQNESSSHPHPELDRNPQRRWIKLHPSPHLHRDKRWDTSSLAGFR